MDTIKVLLTGAGAPGGPGIIKSLLNVNWIKLFTCDADESATGRFLCENFFTIPKADHPEFISTILSFCIKHEIKIIFPLVTRELFLFSKAKNLFYDRGIKVIVSDFDGLSIANNKSELYKHLKFQQIITPDFFVVNNLEEFTQAVIDLGYPNKPVCFKPSISNGSRGFRILDSSVDPYKLLFNEKPNNTYASFDQIREILTGKPFIELLVSEYLPGDEFTIDCIAQDGECLVILPRRRIKMIEGISVKGQFLRNEEIIEYCKKIIKSLGLTGPIGLQVKRAFDGKYKILEINPRIQGTSCSAMALGLNLPLLAITQSVGKPILIDYDKLNWGIHFARYWEEVYYA